MSRPGKILLVDDDAKLLRLISIGLERAGYECHCVTSGEEALASIGKVMPRVVITDARMSGIDGMTLFGILHEREPTLPIIILTAHGTIPDAVDATQRGVFAYMTKPFDNDELLRNVEQALRLFGPAAEATRDWAEGIITCSERMRSLLMQARRVALSESSVLLQGESGSGKELLARAMHRASRRAGGPFVAVNCMAIPETLFEAELFGHVKGAFTGATHERPGLLQSAHGGTLLLDEIADMPAPFQGKLLRALQEKEVRPVGAARAVGIDVRTIAASHKDLATLVEQRGFREDLYYRLGGVTLEIPSLSARREDIPVLAEYFLAQAVETDQLTTVKGFSREAMEALIGAPWPGNVRQLRNVVGQCAVLATAPLISAELVTRALRGRMRRHVPLSEARDRFELEYLVDLLHTTAGNVAQAARLAERNRSEFYSLLKKHGLNPETFREDASSAHDSRDRP